MCHQEAKGGREDYVESDVIAERIIKSSTGCMYVGVLVIECMPVFMCICVCVFDRGCGGER